MNWLSHLAKLDIKEKRRIADTIGGQPRSLELLNSILSETETRWDTIKGKLSQVKKEAYEDLF